jgi:hypothetical protein
VGKVTGDAKVYLVAELVDRNPDEVGYLIDISEYIVGGDFTMSKSRPREVARYKVLDFVEQVLGINPALVSSVHIEDDEIEVELVTFRMVD